MPRSIATASSAISAATASAALFHDAPEVVHVGRPGTGPELQPGMFFTIEPMINIGRPDVKLLDDGWTAVTRDRSLSAQFEHSIGITEDGCEIFTQEPERARRAALCLSSGAARRALRRCSARISRQCSRQSAQRLPAFAAAQRQLHPNSPRRLALWHAY